MVLEIRADRIEVARKTAELEQSQREQNVAEDDLAACSANKRILDERAVELAAAAAAAAQAAAAAAQAAAAAAQAENQVNNLNSSI